MSENKSSSSLLKSIIYGVVFGVLTGVLWAYLNPVPIIPGMIHLRLFSFIPPVVGIIFGMKAGFFSGYIGTVVWGLLAGTFIPIHSLIGDGIGVGFTGLIPAMMVGAKYSLADIAEKKNIMWKSLLWSVLAGVIMIIIPAAALPSSASSTSGGASSGSASQTSRPSASLHSLPSTSLKSCRT